MKPVIKSLSIGQRVWALVEEVVDETHIIANFNGDLVGISNQTGLTMKQGQRIAIMVVTKSPLKFKLVQPTQKRMTPGKFRVNA